MNILKKLTLKNLKLNRTRTIVTVIGIMLSAALITTVAGMADCGRKTMIEAEKVTSGDYELSLKPNSTDDLKDIKAHRFVQDVYIKSDVGIAKMDDAQSSVKKYYDIIGLNSQGFTDGFSFKLKEGRFPQNSSEIVIPQETVDSAKKTYKIGDTITLSIGKRQTEDGIEIPNYMPYNTYYDDEMNYQSCNETFSVESTKKYTVVGFVSDTLSNVLTGDLGTACTNIYTLYDGKLNDSTLYCINFTDDGEKDFVKNCAALLNVPDKDLDKLETRLFSGDVYDEQLGDYQNYSANTGYLKYKGQGLSDQTMQTLFSLAAIIIVIIIFASVFVIRNSFAISITEKTKLYGMIASVGATKRQIFKNVLFEGFVLGIIGIPLGLILGVGVIAILIAVLNLLLSENLNGINFVFSMPILPMIIAVVLSALTIFLSTISTAVRTSKISPVTAIRSNQDIKVKNKKYKTPKYIKKLFGIGGAIAHKNLKRSKKKYRTTVISLIVSIAMFISMSAFMDGMMSAVDSTYDLYHSNIMINTYTSTAQKNSDEFVKEFEENVKKIKQLKGIENTRVLLTNESEFSCTDLKLTDEGNEHMSDSPVCINGCDADTYNKITKELGLDSDKVKDGAIIINSSVYRDENGRAHEYKITSNEVGDKLTFELYDNQATFSLNISALVNEIPDYVSDLIYDTNINVIIPYDKFVSVMPDEAQMCHGFLAINTENATTFEENITDLGLENINVMNVDLLIQTNKNVMLIFAIFIYGFIAVITLIGVTNIFNTISTNMRLRSKEFATLKSIGMTKREFNRMIRLESLFYGIKSLIIGIPIGLLGGVLIFIALNEPSFNVPWLAMIICIIAVFFIIWMIMKFSVAKVSKQNIIETIRNDNI